MASVRIFLVVLLLLGVSLLFVNLSFISVEQGDEKPGGHTAETVHVLPDQVDSTDTTKVAETTAYEAISFSFAMESLSGDELVPAADDQYGGIFSSMAHNDQAEDMREVTPPRRQQTGGGAEMATVVEVWPQPRHVQSGSKLVRVDLDNFGWDVQSECPQFSRRVWDYKTILKYDLVTMGTSLKPIGSFSGTPKVATGLVVIHVDDPEGTWEEKVHDEYYPDGDMPFGYNEHYKLRIPNGGPIEIEVSCFYGFVAAVSTLKQLVAVQDRANVFVTGAPLEITDAPEFPHRGFMIDTGRSFLSKPLIRKTIDAMSLLKLNVLHWHLVDDQSFAVECKAYPQLSRDGAYWMGYVWDHVPIDKGRYSQDDLREIVQYADERGIRVIPEVDVPGHCRGWSIAFPNMTVQCPGYQDAKRNIQDQNKFKNGDYHVNMPLDVTNPFALKVVSTFLEEMGAIFHDPAFHVGSDEPPAACWNEDTSFRSRMAAIDRSLSPHAYLLRQVRDMFRSSPVLENRTLTLWDDGVGALNEAGMAKDHNVVQFWRSWGSSHARALPAIAADSLLILSPSAWYLDIPRPQQAIVDWKATYNDPTFFELAQSVQRSGHLIGGEACAWMMTESYQVSREGSWPIHFNTLVWHRLMPIAERLWRGKGQMPPGSNKRFESTRCLLAGIIDISPAEELHC